MIDWTALLAVYRVAIEDGANPDRVVRRYLAQHGHSIERLAEVRAELERRAAEPEPAAPVDDPPPEPAPLYPPPPAPAPQAEPAITSPAPAKVRQESIMSSADLGAVLLRALPTALSLYQVAHDSGAIDEIADAIGGVSKRAARLARGGPLADDERASLCRDTEKEIRRVLPDLPEKALEALGEVVIDAIDERTNTGPLDEIDGPVAKRGLAALIERIDLWSLDAGNLEARVQRARRRAEKARAEADRLEAILQQRRARG